MIKQTCACGGAQAVVFDEESRTWLCGSCILERHQARLHHGNWNSGSCSDGPKQAIMSPTLKTALRGRGIWVPD